MYLRRLRVQHLKLLRDVELDFSDLDGKSIRMWTVIIGKNGTGKTSLLQAVALAAAGGLQVNTLAGRAVGHLRDRRSSDPLQVEASFELVDAHHRAHLHPLLRRKPPRSLALKTSVSLAEGETTIRAEAQYSGVKDLPKRDPLDEARSRNTPLWFVAGYGVARFLPDVGRAPTLDRPSIERMQPLFDPMAALASTNFSMYFGDDDEKARRFHLVLKHALLNVESLLPDIADLELRGKGGVTKPGDLLERDRFLQTIGDRAPLKVPGLALAHGYQSTIAWIADLVGHVVFEAEADVEPEHMEGLVLVDEIDLYLHPVWQATLIPAIRKTFPKMQFIVTTHSPVVLSGVAPHEIVRVASCGDAGDVVEVVHDPETGELVPANKANGEGIRPDARMMTGSEIFREHFGLEGATPNPMGDDLRRYTMLAGDPFRSEAEHEEMQALGRLLQEHDIGPLPRVVRRRKG